MSNQFQVSFREEGANKEDAEKRAECFRNYKQTMPGNGDDLWWDCGDDTKVGRNIKVQQLEIYNVVDNGSVSAPFHIDEKFHKEVA